MELTKLKGVGEKTKELFIKAGVANVCDLLYYFPLQYREYNPPVNIADLIPGQTFAVSGIITKRPLIRRGKRAELLISEISDKTGKIQAIWFNASYYAGLLKSGQRLVLYGKVAESKGKLILEHAEIFTPEKYSEIMSTLKPVYGLTKGLSNNTVIKAIKQALKLELNSFDFLPFELIRYCDLIGEADALKMIHFPKGMEELAKARRRLIFDEFFLFITEMKLLKSNNSEKKEVVPFERNDITGKIMAALPYELTASQLKAWSEIERDLCSDKMMNRLLQGDVGSGKTVIAFLAMILTAYNGFQAALMAPTEVLAAQHYEKFLSLCKKAKLENINPVLLTGSLKEKDKARIHGDIETGEFNVIIGTHALIQDTVRFNALGLVATDEQHRFGVRHRKSFLDEANPNLMVMSATPIPRTLGLIYYGDLDITTIDEKPAMRLPIKNAVVDKTYENAANKFIASEIKAGHQVYIICPMIEGNDESDLHNVMDFSNYVKAHIKGAKVATLHGRMTGSEKEKVMGDFAAGRTNVLVSTTVIEVGIDVPNATVMMVMNAERFGLATLHQLRGRVGRGEYQSYCIFVADKLSDTIKERLDILASSNDGFDIANKDLELRGPGDILGLRQSGDIRFTLGDLAKDRDIFTLANEAACSILKDDPALTDPENLLLKNKIDEYINKYDRNIVL